MLGMTKSQMLGMTKSQMLEYIDKVILDKLGDLNKFMNDTENQIPMSDSNKLELKTLVELGQFIKLNID